MLWKSKVLFVSWRMRCESTLAPMPGRSPRRLRGHSFLQITSAIESFIRPLLIKAQCVLRRWSSCHQSPTSSTLYLSIATTMADMKHTHTVAAAEPRSPTPTDSQHTEKGISVPEDTQQPTTSENSYVLLHSTEFCHPSTDESLVSAHGWSCSEHASPPSAPAAR
jgi:hypothetical protein